MKICQNNSIIALQKNNSEFDHFLQEYMYECHTLFELYARSLTDPQYHCSRFM